MYPQTDNFIFDPILSDTLYGGSGRAGGITPERELMLAILADAIHCYRKYRDARDTRSARIFQETDQWLFTDDEKENCSFLNVCDALSLNPAYIRRGIVSGLGKPARLEADKVPARSRSRSGRIRSNFDASGRSKIRLRRFKG